MPLVLISRDGYTGIRRNVNVFLSDKGAVFMTLHVSPQTRRVFYLSLPIFAELLLQLLVGNMDQFMTVSYTHLSQVCGV